MSVKSVSSELLSLSDLKQSLLRLAPGEDPEEREHGRDWPAEAETMIGRQRLDQLEQAVLTVLDEGIPGDLVETGVWRGGACILMRAVLKHHGSDRTVWLADSFQGLPKPDANLYPLDFGDGHWQRDELAISLDEVEANFARYGLLDDQVRFLKGWFCDTLPVAPVKQIALLRLDGDMYGSTWEALESLYPKVSAGGFVIVDDYNSHPNCREAVEDYCRRHKVRKTVTRIDWTGVYWRKGAREE